MSVIKICNRFALTLTKLAKETALVVCGAKMMKHTGLNITALTVIKDGQQINETIPKDKK
jgi:hypothetical protein